MCKAWPCLLNFLLHCRKLGEQVDDYGQEDLQQGAPGRACQLLEVRHAVGEMIELGIVRNGRNAPAMYP